jgi:molecular chaperone GrpE
MSKHETELKVLERAEAARIAAIEEPVSEEPGSPQPVVRNDFTPYGEIPDESPSPDQPVSRAEFEQLRVERDQLLDRLARLQAEFENARKRGERERIADRDYATVSVIEQFLPVLDHFELALKSTGSVDQLRSGVELIVKQMEDVLRQMQVTPIAAVGEPFDPRHHEALGSVERNDMPDQHVAEEIRRGYRLRDKLLRPALVRVASNPKQTSE